MIVPGITSTPGGLAILADKLAESIDILKAWRLRVPATSRLLAAVRLLRETSTLSEYPDNTAQLHRIGTAIRIGFDFYHITRCLTEDRVDAVAEDLRRALKGTLDDSGPTEANRAQSQVLVGAVLAVGGLRPAAPVPGEGQTPDYITFVDGLRYGAEIKRPASASQILNRVDDAVNQIFKFPSEAGLIVLDLSDCLLDEEQETTLDLAIVEPVFRGAYRSISDHLEHSQRAGVDKIANLFVFANLFGWERSTSPIPRALFPTYSEVIHRARAGLISAQSLRVRDQIEEGFQVFQAELIEKRRVSWRS